MKYIFTLLSILFIVCGLTFSANAGRLIDNGHGTFTDTDTGLMWLNDDNYAYTSGYDDDGLMTWDEAMAWADTLIYAGYDDWRLPSAYNSDGTGPCEGYNCTDSEMGHLYYIHISGATNDYYWSGTYAYECYSGNECAWGFALGCCTCCPGMQDYCNIEHPWGAWAVRDQFKCPDLPVRIEGTSFEFYSIQDVYDAAEGGVTIQSQSVIFTEDLYIDDIDNKSVFLRAGYDCDYENDPGETVLKGDMIISNGTLIIESGILKVM